MKKFTRVTAAVIVAAGAFAATASSFAAPTKTIPMQKWPPVVSNYAAPTQTIPMQKWPPVVAN